jgi:hypothetical protein
MEKQKFHVEHPQMEPRNGTKEPRNETEELRNGTEEPRRSTEAKEPRNGSVGSMCHTIERTDRQGYPNC